MFETADGVTLAGTYYPGGKGRKSPAVLLLHDVGDDEGQKAWDRLARSLQKDGMTVLTFDFRGHGLSTEVDEDFWDQAVNRELVPQATGRGTSPT